MISEKPLHEHIQEMKKMASFLIPYSHPNVSFADEYDTLPLKCRNIFVEGYEFTTSYSIADYKKYSIESVQVQLIHGPFAPFSLVCNIGKAFLGNDDLFFIDFMKNNRKIYCWTLRKDKNGASIPVSKAYTDGYYEGFEYKILDRRFVNLY
jgi:hypothetical protein